MAITITSNIASLGAQKNLQVTQDNLNKSISRLSSGYKIVTAQDDPAGLAVSERLRAQVRGIKQAEKNANDGISFLQVAEGALAEVSNVLIRMRELSVQASNGTLSSADRGFLNTEFLQLRSEIDRISESTKFNNLNILNGTFSQGAASLIIQIGLYDTPEDMLTVTLRNVGSEALGSGTMLNTITISQSAGQARDIIKFIDAAIDDVSQSRSVVGSQLSRLVSVVQAQLSLGQNLTAAVSRIRDVDVAEETSQLTRSQILMQAGVSVLGQANASPQVALNLIG